MILEDEHEEPAVDRHASAPLELRYPPVMDSNPPRRSDPRWRPIVHHLATAIGALSLFAGAAGTGMAPSTLAAAEDPGRWYTATMSFLALGLVSLALARWQRPWHQHPEREVLGGILGWLAWVFGALLLGAGGNCFALCILALGVWVLVRRHRRNRASCEREAA